MQKRNPKINKAEKGQVMGKLTKIDILAFMLTYFLFFVIIIFFLFYYL